VRRFAASVIASIALVTGVLAPGAGGGEAVFAQGVAAGEIGPGSALLWTRAPRAGGIEVSGSCTARGRTTPLRGTGRARAADDRTITIPVRGLPAGARCTYRFQQADATSPTGRFETAPAASADVPVRFAYSGDADATPGLDGKPAYNGFQTYARMAAERNDFNVNLGDTIYSDSEVADAPVALTVPAKWGKYRLGLGLAPLRTLRAATGLYSHWDDHEFVNDFSRAEHGASVYAAGMKAFRDYAPVAYAARTGLYRTVRWGRNVELFFLDERSFRSAKATAACNGDLAPTAPAGVRAAFAAIAPPLAQPVPAGCREAIDDPSRTMLGAAQLTAFTKAIRASTATWKLVVNEVPLMQLYALPYDRWEGYGAERARVIETLRSVRNVVVLTTDTHAHLIGEVRSRTLEPAGPDSTGIWEVITGPVATNTYAKEIDAVLGAPGSGDFVTSLFFEPAPPRGLGLRCSATDAYGYAQVVATRTTLTVTPKDSSGRPVREKTGATCAPLVLRAR
jgi:phosphodiesterase/alkaline phosphatase D-like protein